MKNNIYEVLEQLFAGNLFPADINTVQGTAQEQHISRIKGFSESLNPVEREKFTELMDEVSSIQADAEQAFFEYGVEFAAAFLLRTILEQDAYNIMLEKIKP